MREIYKVLNSKGMIIFTEFFYNFVYTFLTESETLDFFFFIIKYCKKKKKSIKIKSGHTFVKSLFVTGHAQFRSFRDIVGDHQPENSRITIVARVARIARIVRISY